jgi:PAS domain S-box-containing protein
MAERRPKDVLGEENRQLRSRIEGLETVLHAIRSGEVDALVLSKPEGEQVLPLQGALEPYRVMVEAMGEGAVSLSGDSSILYCNAHFAELVRMPREQIVGLPLHGMFAEPDRKKLGKMISQGLKKPMRGELTLLASDGMRIPVQLSMCPLPESDGKAVSVVVTDLSEVHAAADALTQLALIVESSDDAIVSTTLDGLIKTWNGAAEELYGYTADEVIGRAIQDVIVPPDLFDEVNREFQAIRQSKRTIYADTVRRRNDGTRVDVSVKSSPIFNAIGRVIGASINSRDITEHKRMEEERNRATYLLGERHKEVSCLHAISTIVSDSELSIEQRLQRAVEKIPSGFQYPEVTCARITLAGIQYSSADFKETAWWLACDIEEDSGESGSLEVFYTEERPASDEGPFLREERNLINSIGRTLGDFLRFEHTLSQLLRFRDLVDASNDAVFVIDPGSARIVDVNRQASDALGYSRDEVLRLHVFDVDTVAPSESAWDASVKELQKAGSWVQEGEHRRKDGSTFPVEASVRYVSRDEGDYIIAIVRDITERKQAEQALRASKDLLLAVVENAPIRVFWKDVNLRYLGCNSAFAHDAGISRPEELIGKDDFQMGWTEQAEVYRADDQAVVDSGISRIGSEERQTTPDGGTKWLRTSKVPLRTYSQIIGVLGLYEDITDQKLADDALKRANRALGTLSDVNLALVRAAGEDELLKEIANVIVRNNNYRLAMVSYADDNPEKSITTKAWSSPDDNYSLPEDISWADTEQGQLPLAKAIRSGVTQVCHDISSEPGFAPWKKAALTSGYVSNVALPLMHIGKAFGGLAIYSIESAAFDSKEVRLLEELADSLTYGIGALRNRVEHEQDALRLRESLEQSIQTIADTVAARDPYTAGHQRRVGDLATAIARKMGLTEDQIDGIHLAAIIHDFGKIHIPAEILVKPGKLNEIEYMLVKTHPQAGYDILKDVKFPWPIAEIIRQHHERLDGSGYPQGLKGNDILLEAKIIAVADVVEAMSSHRPYRPGLGIESALKEIECRRGELYDPEAVAACLELFREEGYTLPA